MNHEYNNNKKVKDEAVNASACINCEGGCSCDGACGSRCNLHSYNWLEDVPGNDSEFDIVEVHFKNTRRGFYRNSSHLSLKQGDMVAVEANPGHDIGEVAMTGRLVKLQMKRANLRPDAEILRVFRKAKPQDLERYEEAKAREVDTMIRSRKIAVDLGLKMKIGDVEYQGDGNKAIFYYIADERVDFRQLIKVLADVFKIRVEMKQIGARQEAGRIGGIGPCGRPLCCASWMTNFVSVATSAARFQDISLNPQKLAGQCAKLKCCINFEVDTYVEASKSMPTRDVILETKDGLYYYFKADVIKREIMYSTDKNMPVNVVTLPAARVFEVMALNRNGIKPDKLSLDDDAQKAEQKAFGDILGQDAINRFDKKKKKKSKNKRQGGNDGAAEGQGKERSREARGERQRGDKPRGERQRGDRQRRQDGNQQPAANGEATEQRQPRQRQQRRQPNPNGENANAQRNDRPRRHSNGGPRHQGQNKRKNEKGNGNKNEANNSQQQPKD
ncbi:MAG: hypothetical protein MJZ74_05965 [Muribaculaceae bacterium]|nr:hypothetical protein [Muribaculaceae bacterium]